MIKDRAAFILDYRRNSKAHFVVEFFNSFKTYIAVNRAARRLLKSNRIAKLADIHGAKIEIDNDYTCIF
jgi:hypothetical protein